MGFTWAIVSELGCNGIPLKLFKGGGAFTGWRSGLSICMSFNETSEAEVAQINKYFPNRSPEEVRRAIEDAKASFHGSRGGKRAEILSQLLS